MSDISSDEDDDERFHTPVSSPRGGSDVESGAMTPPPLPEAATVPERAEQSFEAKLLHLYNTHAPAESHKVAGLVAKYEGDAVKEAYILSRIAEKYGVQQEVRHCHEICN